MNFNFEEYRYFGHATENEPFSDIENGIKINKDIYGKKELRSTTIEIKEDDLEEGLDSIFSLNTSLRKYLEIIACEKDDYEMFKEDVENNSLISPENICGYYNEYLDFTPNEECPYYEESVTLK